MTPELERLGHRPVPLTLPGRGDGAAYATLDEQLAAVLAALDAASGPVTVVGHSAASTLAWLAADARPERVARVVLIGGFPGRDARAHAASFPIEDGAMPFPGWEPFAGPDSAALTELTLRQLADAAIPVPEGVARGVVRFTDERRFDVPVTVVCPEFSPEEANGWIESGEIPELARAKHVELTDIAAGHRPMFTRPRELARLLAAVL